jgi:hypothetical protein
MRKLIAALFVSVLFAMPAAGQTSVMMQLQSGVGEPTALSRSLGVDVTHRITEQGGILASTNFGGRSSGILAGVTATFYEGVSLAVASGVARRANEGFGAAYVVDTFAGVQIGDDEKALMIGLGRTTNKVVGIDAGQADWASRTRITIIVGPAF